MFNIGDKVNVSTVNTDEAGEIYAIVPGGADPTGQGPSQHISANFLGVDCSFIGGGVRLEESYLVLYKEKHPITGKTINSHTGGKPVLLWPKVANISKVVESKPVATVTRTNSRSRK